MEMAKQTHFVAAIAHWLHLILSIKVLHKILFKKG